MMEAVLKIIREFLEEQYPYDNIEYNVTNKSYFNTNKETTEYTFEIERILGKDPYTWTWIILSDNRSGANVLFRNEIYFRYNNIKNAEILTNQLELLGLIKLY